MTEDFTGATQTVRGGLIRLDERKICSGGEAVCLAADTQWLDGRAYRLGTERNGRYRRTEPAGAVAGPASVRREFYSAEEVRRPVGIRTPAWTVLAMLLCAAVICLCVHASGSGKIRSLQMRIDQTRLQLMQLNQTNREIEEKIAKAADPARIQTLAMNRLGMVQPQEGQVIRISANTNTNISGINTAAEGGQNIPPVILLSSAGE